MYKLTSLLDCTPNNEIVILWVGSRHGSTVVQCDRGGRAERKQGDFIPEDARCLGDKKPSYLLRVVVTHGRERIRKNGPRLESLLWAVEADGPRTGGWMGEPCSGHSGGVEPGNMSGVQ